MADWVQVNFPVPPSWREAINKRAKEWGCDAQDLWIAAIDSLFASPARARSLGTAFTNIREQDRASLENLKPGEGGALAKKWLAELQAMMDVAHLEETPPEQQSRGRRKGGGG